MGYTISLWILWFLILFDVETEELVDFINERYAKYFIIKIYLSWL